MHPEKRGHGDYWGAYFFQKVSLGFAEVIRLMNGAQTMQMYGNLSDFLGKIECIVWDSNVITPVLLLILQVASFEMWKGFKICGFSMVFMMMGGRLSHHHPILPLGQFSEQMPMKNPRESFFFDLWPLRFSRKFTHGFTKSVMFPFWKTGTLWFYIEFFWFFCVWKVPKNIQNAIFFT